jgi:Flp pilus assembly secretin CpaC
VLGDLPGVGVLFQSSSKTVTKKNLMIFVTATIVDPAGNRVHSDDELPFAQAAIPEQPEVKGQTFQPVMPVTAAPPNYWTDRGAQRRQEPWPQKNCEPVADR